LQLRIELLHFYGINITKLKRRDCREELIAMLDIQNESIKTSEKYVSVETLLQKFLSISKRI